MKNSVTRIIVFGLTLGFGVSVVSILNSLVGRAGSPIKIARIISSLETPKEFLLESSPGIRKIYFKDGSGFIEVSEGLQKRFVPTSRGCGNGYVQSYVTNDGYRLSEGVWKTSSKEFQKYFLDVTILKQVKNAKNRHGEIGVRYEVNGKDENGNKYFQILWYGNGTLHDITAPSIGIALEFENSQSYAY